MAWQLSHEINAFNQFCKETDELYRVLARRTGLSDSAFCVLYTLGAAEDGCLQKDVCELFWLSKQTVHSAVQQLERDGLLYRVAAAGRDRKLVLTDAGQQFVRAQMYPVYEIEDAAFSDLPAHERHEMLRLMQRYVALFRARINLSATPNTP